MKRRLTPLRREFWGEIQKKEERKEDVKVKLEAVLDSPRDFIRLAKLEEEPKEVFVAFALFAVNL